MYAHLSRIAVSGGRVDQGQVIGYVGRTGVTTGPHLDFRIIQRGNFVNPRQLVVPPDPPISEASIARFIARRDELRGALDQFSRSVELSSR